MATHAVITGDIVNSTKLDGRAEKKLIATLQKVLEPYKFEFYRGDSFQVYIREADKALQTVLLCRTVAIATKTKDEAASCDIRMSIGIGNVVSPLRSLASAKGEAFVLSGRAFDLLSQTDTRLAISIAEKGQKGISYGFELVAAYIDSIYRGMSIKKAEVIFELLSGGSQQDAVKNLKKSKSTVSEIASSAKWPEIEWILTKYKKLINEIQ